MLKQKSQLALLKEPMIGSKEESLKRVYRVALRFLGHKPRTCFQMREKLKSFDERFVEEVIDDFKARGYLDDLLYAQRWIQERRAVKRLGDRKIRYELKQKGLDDGVISSAFLLTDEGREESELEQAVASLSRKYLNSSTLTREDEFKQDKKMAQYLIRKGYSSGVVRSAIIEIKNQSVQK